jgi:hypothetical protein
MADTYTNGAELASILQQLAARSAGDQARALERYRGLVEQVARGELSADAVRAQYDRLVAEESARFTRELVALGVRYYQSLIDLNRAYVDRLFDELGAAERASQARASHVYEQRDRHSEPVITVVDLELRGRLGETVRAGFAIENKRADPAEVVFLVSDFVGGNQEPFRAPVRLDPPRFPIPPHGERRVELSVELDPALFAAGHRYRGEVLVRSQDEFTLRVAVEVEEAVSPSGEVHTEGGEQ